MPVESLDILEELILVSELLNVLEGAEEVSTVADDVSVLVDDNVLNSTVVDELPDRDVAEVVRTPEELPIGSTVVARHDVEVVEISVSVVVAVAVVVYSMLIVVAATS